jgi:hypothetical protein
MKVLFSKVPNCDFNNELIEYYIKLFINDIESLIHKKPIKWYVKLWLDGIQLEVDSIILLNEVTLRRVQKEEFVLSRPQTTNIDDFEMVFGKTLIFSAVLEFNMNCVHDPQNFGLTPKSIVNVIDNWINTLSLFNVGNILVIQLDVIPDSVLEYPIRDVKESSYSTSWISNNTYQVRELQTKSFETFIEKIKPIIENNSVKSNLSGNFNDLAFHHYNEALSYSKTNIYKIISAISALEAIFNESGMDITYKISNRIAGILRFYGYDSIEISKLIKNIYKIRSSLVHGAELNKKKLKIADDNIFKILDYTRICLLISLQLIKVLQKENNISLSKVKDKFISLIDNSLIDRNAYAKLESLLEQHVILPVSNEFVTVKKSDSSDTIHTN